MLATASAQVFVPSDTVVYIFSNVLHSTLSSIVDFETLQFIGTWCMRCTGSDSKHTFAINIICQPVTKSPTRLPHKRVKADSLQSPI